MENTRDRLIRYLDDCWAVEKALVDTLQSMADEVNDPQVRALFLEHRQQTHAQEEALEARIRALGEEPSGGKGFLNKLMAKFGDAMQGAHDEYDKTSQDLMKAFATENFECAMYESLASFCDTIGDAETSALARQIMAEEKQAAQRVWQLIAPCAARAAEPLRQAA